MTKILAYRFSAFGDVAMTAVVFREFLEQNPDVEIIMVSRDQFSSIFDEMERVKFKGINLEDYKGFFGMRKLANQLIKEFHPDYVADLHDVIRTKILKRIFKTKGYNVSVINKGKEEKESLTDVWNITKNPLKKTTERYADVFRDLGFDVVLSHQYRIQNQEKEGIGFAPFAQHSGKMLPLEKSFELAKILSQKYKLYFFGGGEKETKILYDWQNQLPNTINLAGQLSLKEEIKKIAELELMIAMDSANMHLASLVGTRCLSIWGATHHFAGFLGYGQSEDDIIEVKDLTCRPCSVFGDLKCYRGDYACLNEIEVNKIVEKVDNILTPLRNKK